MRSASRCNTPKRFAPSKRRTSPSSRGWRRHPGAVKIALLPGDGIGPEILAEAVKLLERLRRDGLPIETESAPIGGAGYAAAGQPLPESTLQLAQAAEAVLM